MPANTTKPRTVHRQIIDDLCAQYPEIKTRGFFKALRNLPDAEYVPWTLKHDDGWDDQVRFVPDAWAINEKEREVVIFEVVCTNDITDAKFSKIANLAWALDEDYYTLGLVRCTEAGRRAYDPQMAWLHALHDNADQPEGQRLKGWRRYTSDVTQDRKAA